MVFGVQTDVPHNGGNAAQRREHDKRVGAGAMSRTGATCPCRGAIMTMEDLRFEGRSAATMTAVVVDRPKGKEYRLPTDVELRAAEVSKEELAEEADAMSGAWRGASFLCGQLRLRPMGETVYETATKLAGNILHYLA